MAKFDEYTLGLDIGVGSVGWAVVDNDYKLIKLNGKNAWGSVLFESGETAENTRIKRGARVRYDRRKKRIQYLQMLLGDIVLDKDDSFFIKLKQSFLHNQKSDSNSDRLHKYNLFNNDLEQFQTDKELYKQFPTIYHLRDYIANTTDKVDARLVYLALHHIIKYRGNFLREGESIDINNNDIQEQIQNFIENLYEKTEINLDGQDIGNKIAQILQNPNLKKGKKVEEIQSLYDKDNKSISKVLASALLGNKFSTKTLFGENSIIEENDKEKTISFSDKDYEEKEDFYLSCLGENSDLLVMLKTIYYSLLFQEVLFEQQTISKAMIARYNKHKIDLIKLKNLYKQLGESKTKDFFRNPKGNNYVNYVRTKNTKLKAQDGIISREKLYISIKNDIQDLEDSQDKAYCLEEMEKDNFLPKLNDVRNASIPYQFQKNELEAILDSQSVHYESLAQNRDKIISILTFKRPYYVGKLKGKYSWNEQKITEPVYPWNFEELVDYKHCEEQFITRMTNNCQFFAAEESLPKNSMINQAYTVLNELNGTRVNDKNLSPEVKKDVFINLFCTKKTVSKKDLIFYLKNHYGNIYSASLKEDSVSGLSDDKKFLSSMSTLADFKRILGDNFKQVVDKNGFVSQQLDIYESVVRHLSIFDDKKVRVDGVKGMLDITDKQAENLSKLKYSGWGRYSKKFLHGILTSQRKTILQTMLDSVVNINAIIFDKSLGIDKQIKSDIEKIDKFDYDQHIEPLYCSPSVKKSIWNCCKVIEEIVKVSGTEPTRIFLENTQEDQESKKTISRTDKLVLLYKSLEKDDYSNSECVEYLNSQKKENINITKDKFYLWLLQLGRCMYSGEVIPLNKIDDCEIDHIVPRCYIKDDSFENRVLVKKIENQNKSGSLALSHEIRSKMNKFWTFLYSKKMIGSKKYRNLNKAEYTDNDSKRFIDRQLVETSQTIKEVQKLLNRRFPECTIEGIKATMNTLFRQSQTDKGNYEFYKLRNLNHLHHAKDAYLTAVIGQFTSVAYPLWGQDKESLKLKYYMDNNDKAYDSYRTLSNKRYGLILDAMQNKDITEFGVDENGEYKWSDIKYNNVLRTMDNNDCLVVKQKSFEARNDFYKETIYKKDSGMNMIPRKYYNNQPLDPLLYGGYSGEEDLYYCVIKYNVPTKKLVKTEYELIGIPTREAYKIKKLNEKEQWEYLEAYLGQKVKEQKNGQDLELLKIVYKYQLIEMDGHLVSVVGESEVSNAKQFYCNKRFNKLLYLIESAEKEEKSANSKRNAINLLLKEEQYDKLIDEFIEEYTSKMQKLYPLYDKTAQKINDYFVDGYRNLSMQQKIDFVKKLLIITYASSGRVEFGKTFIGGTAGRIIKRIHPTKVKWIDNSTTGLYTTSKVFKE